MYKTLYSNKIINFAYKGYVLYDNNLLRENFINSLHEMVKIHDIFKIRIDKRQTVLGTVNYFFENIYCLDKIDLKDVLLNLEEAPLKQVAEFKLIYFQDDLKGFYYRFNGFLFDRRSVMKVLCGVEKHYFEGQSNQAKMSYIKWLDDNPKSFEIISKSRRYQSKTKVLSLDEDLTKNIRSYIQLKDMTMFQFMTGVLGIYYKVCKRKDLVFMTEYFNENALDLVGDLSPTTSYALKKNPNVLSHEFIKNDWVQLEKYSHIKINMKDHCETLKGHETQLYTNETPFEMDLLIDEKNQVIDLEMTYQKYKIKKEEMFLMLNKIRMILYDVLENDTSVRHINLLTRKEEQIVLKHVHVAVTNHYKSVYEQFRTLVASSGNRIVISDGKEMSFSQLASVVERIKKILSKSNVKGETIDLSLLNTVDKIAAFIAMDSVEAVYSDQYTYQLKKGLLGYKLDKVFEQGKKCGQYLINDVIISREGYTNYCQFMKDYFHLNSGDVVSDDEFLKFVMPVLLAGGQIRVKAPKEEVTIAELDSNDLKDYPKMRHVITNEKSCQTIYDYNLYFGISFTFTVPFSFMGKIINGQIKKWSPVNGLGFVILNNNFNLSQVFETGELYMFGPSVTNKFDYEFLNINGIKIKNVVQSGERATWFLDESLKL